MLDILIFLIGLGLVLRTLLSAVATFVLPRSFQDPMVRPIFRVLRRIFELKLLRIGSFEERDNLLALFAPIALMLLLPTWLLYITTGYTMMFKAIGPHSWYQSFVMSGSSLLTLGFEKGEGWLWMALSFSEALIGLIMVALLIAYLPTIYAAFSAREREVTLLEVRAGSPPSAQTLLLRYFRLSRPEAMTTLWTRWEGWFAELEESHTSLAALSFFRSPMADHSWVTAAGTVLDAAALRVSLIDLPPDPRANLCIRAGFLALRRIADAFGIAHNADPHFPEDPIHVSREAFDELVHALQADEIALKSDLDQAWKDFAGWRVNYDSVLLSLCQITVAPPAPWSTDLIRADAPHPFNRR